MQPIKNERPQIVNAWRIAVTSVFPITLCCCSSLSPESEEFKAACATVPPVESSLPMLYKLDTNRDGIVVIDQPIRNNKNEIIDRTIKAHFAIDWSSEVITHPLAMAIGL